MTDLNKGNIFSHSYRAWKYMIKFSGVSSTSLLALKVCLTSVFHLVSVRASLSISFYYKDVSEIRTYPFVFV